MQEQITQLKTDQQQLGKNFDILKAQTTEDRDTLLKKFAELSAALEDYNHSTRIADADFGAQLEHMIQDVQQLRGAVEVNEHRIGETETKLQETLSKRLDAISKQPPPGDDPAGTAVLESLPKGKKEALAYAAKLLKDRKPDDARAAYRAIVKQWPKEAGTTDEALFRLGEIFYTSKQFEAALREYIKIVDKFGTGTWVDDAYYKIGLCSAELGRLDDAQTFFSEVFTHYKKSPLAKSAKIKFDEISKRIRQSHSNNKDRGKKRAP